jgi:hypothetical protein
VAADSPEHTLSSKDLDPSKRGHIMFAGHCANPEMLEGLITIKLRGLVLGSLTTRLRPLAAQMPYPIMVLEGFGNIPINPVAYKLLSTSRDREVTLNAMHFNRATGDRPELVIPVKGGPDVPMPMQLIQLDIGNQVRVLRDPYMGMVGTVTEMLGMQRMENGLMAEAARVTLNAEVDDDLLMVEEKIVVPLANLEIIG